MISIIKFSVQFFLSEHSNLDGVITNTNLTFHIKENAYNVIHLGILSATIQVQI